MPIFLGDGKNKARPVQKTYLSHLTKSWDHHHTFGAHLPTGSGKTFIARTIQRALGSRALILTVSNQLIDQFTNDYPEVNLLKGRKHYDTGFEYHQAYADSRKYESIANPMAYYYAVIQNRMTIPDVLIIDEAHKLYDAMFSTAFMDFDVNSLSIPTFTDSHQLYKWNSDLLERCESRLNSVHTLSDQQQKYFWYLYEKSSMLHQLIKTGDANYNFEYVYLYNKSKRKNTKHLRVTPIRLDKDLFWPFLKAKKLILMSGTLTRYDLKFYDQRADYYNSAYLTKPENRIVKYTPVNQDQRKCPETLAKEVKRLWEHYERPNTMVHVSYDLQAKMAEFLPEALTHTKTDKEDAIRQFKDEGGLFLASGCAEGVDLPDDECRLIIIPTLLYPNLGDSQVQKRKAMYDGTLRYNLDTMMTTIQQLGRGARHANDSCVSHILDPMFSLLYQQTYTHLPNDLNIQWEYRHEV